VRGRFISFEGPEGAGKTSQIRLLTVHLESRGISVVLAREPGGTATGETIRNILQHDAAGEAISPEAELLLFEASRAQLVRRVIEPALAAGKWVVSDRFVDSTTAYQGYGRELDLDTVLRIHKFAVGTTMPDLTILMDIDVSAGMARLHRRNAAAGDRADRIERENIGFHEKVRSGYLELARRYPDRIVTVDASRKPDQVAADVIRIVRERLGLG